MKNLLIAFAAVLACSTFACASSGPEETEAQDVTSPTNEAQASLRTCWKSGSGAELSGGEVGSFSAVCCAPCAPGQPGYQTEPAYPTCASICRALATPVAAPQQGAVAAPQQGVAAAR